MHNAILYPVMVGKDNNVNKDGTIEHWVVIVEVSNDPVQWKSGKSEGLRVKVFNPLTGKTEEYLWDDVVNANTDKVSTNKGMLAVNSR